MSTHYTNFAEVEKFSQQATEWWDLNGTSAPLHAINPLRLDFIKQTISLTNKKVIDIGCGGGILTESLAKEGALVTGIDASETLIKIAQEHAQQNELNIQYEINSAENFSDHTPEKYDCVTCMELLEHTDYPEAVIQSCANLLKPGGRLFLSTLNRTLKAYLLAVLGAEYILGLLPKGTHDYAKFLKPNEIDEWARKTGLKLESMIGITYNPLNKQYSLCEDVSVNYIMHYRSMEYHCGTST